MSTPPLCFPRPSTIANEGRPTVIQHLGYGDPNDSGAVPRSVRMGDSRCRKIWCGFDGGNATRVAPQSNCCEIVIKFLPGSGPAGWLVAGSRSSSHHISRFGCSEHPATIEWSWSPRGVLRGMNHRCPPPRQGHNSEGGVPYVPWSHAYHA